MTVETNESETELYLNRAADLVFDVGIHGVSVIGALFNIITIIVLTTRFFDHNFYNFLRCRCVCNLAVCLVGIFYDPIPDKAVTVEYLPLVYKWFAVIIPMRVLFFASALSDNLIILNRLGTLYEKNNSLFYTLSKKANLFICFSISISVSIPFYFAIQVVKSSDTPTETEGYWTLTDFGETTYFKIYALVLLLIESVIPLISLIVMNLIALVKFRKIKSESVNIDDERAQDTINRYTKLIIILTFICIITRTYDVTIAIYNRVRLFYGIVMTDDLEALLKLLRKLASLILFAEHALDGVLYYIFDQNMRRFLKRDTAVTH